MVAASLRAPSLPASDRAPRGSAAWAALALLAVTAVVTPTARAAEPSPPELRVLSDRTEAHLAPIFAAFERATGVKVVAVYLDKGLVARLESRPVEADVVITKDVDLLELAKQKGLLQPLGSSIVKARVPEAFRDPGGAYFSDGYRARALFYSSERVKPGELSTYEALAEPRWKGRVCVRSGYDDYNISLFGQLLTSYGPERTRRFLTGLHANLARTPAGGDRDQVRGIYEKKCDVSIGNSYYMGIMLGTPEQRPWAQASRVFFPDQELGGTFILRSGLALTQAKRSVAVATQLLEFMVGDEAQTIIAQATHAYPVVAGARLSAATLQLGAGQPTVKDGTFRVHPVAPADIARQRDAVVKLLDELGFDRPR